ncbi:MAG: hypothetical protein LKF61_04775 [Eggerthellaceae bacterium]|jgi:hypothetical protein|nr:hypothetical protein [Eggerthellaceae bacterium]MCH4220551.1 hypothetical protein [Eggerthellaceae bacterium]
MKKKKLVVLISIMAICVVVTLSGCGRPSQPAAADKLDNQVTFQGVTIGYPSEWGDPNKSNVFSLINIPNYGGMVKISSYTKGETKDISSAKVAGGNNGLSSQGEYTLSKTWDEKGIEYSIYTGTSTNYGITSEDEVLLGNKKNTSKGFIVCTSLSEKGQTEENEQIADAIVKTAKFSPDELTTDSADEMEKNIAKNKSTSSSSKSYSSSSNSSSSSTSNQSSSFKSYKAGTYMVGKSFPAGEYRLTATSSGYYCVYPDTKKSEILGNGNFTGVQYVTVTDSQVLLLNDCNATAVADSKVTSKNTLTESGRYEAGIDCPPGTYSLAAGKSGTGYYAVYNSSDPDAKIVQNNNFQNSDIVTIDQGQYLEISRCTASLM